MIVDGLVFEVTRKCNMNCSHCFMGDAEDLNISSKTIDATLDKIEKIYSIGFGGGEPSLNLEAIEYALEACKKRNIPVLEFYMLTNGKEVSDRFIKILNDWYVYVVKCNYEMIRDLYGFWTISEYNEWIQNEIFGNIILSIDKYHKEIPIDNLIKLSSLSFFKMESFDNSPILNMGKAESLTCEKVELSEEERKERFFLNEKICSKLYINAKGDVLSCCKLSYEKQELYKKTNVFIKNWEQILKNK